MATAEELVDLSLFAESPTSDWRFTSSDLPSHHRSRDTDAGIRTPSESSFPAAGFYDSQRPINFSLPSRQPVNFDLPPRRNTFGRSYYDPPENPAVRPLPRSYDLKPLPALPSRRLCKPRPSRTRNDAQSRCILNRLKRTKSGEPFCPRRSSIQQRRNVSSTPQLTLSVHDSARERRRHGPEMVWLPDEQMWLVMDHNPRDLNLLPPSYSAPPVRTQPSPSVYSIPERTPPLTPDDPRQRNPFIDEEGLSPIQSQFRSLIIDAERRSPLFQEAMQTIPDLDSTIESLMNQASDDDWPVYDPAMYETPEEIIEQPVFPDSPISPESPHTPQSSFEEIEREWNSAVSVHSEHEGLRSPHQHQHSGDTSYYSALSEVDNEEFPNDEDAVDFYLHHSPTLPIWSGIAKSISSQGLMRSWTPSTLSHGLSLSSQTSRPQPVSR